MNLDRPVILPLTHTSIRYVSTAAHYLQTLIGRNKKGVRLGVGVGELVLTVRFLTELGTTEERARCLHTNSQGVGREEGAAHKQGQGSRCRARAQGKNGLSRHSS